ncbi:hypothetical protein [Caenispirillum bisanense]|uniref:Uncharacterized protein n=1 Tax=Caenispirillum bisanense TaxID=414052 RepID=A0A286G355_9PROT|nr:hypothetical protein [Caenispirillum bisanense]SOD89980.1 hypothetical protein SAMN05421508_101400 [Caenispirillum bisanense]
MARRSRRQREQSKKFWMGLVKFGVFLGVVGATAYYAYEAGTQLSAQEITELKAEIGRLSQTEQAQQQRIGELEAGLTSAEQVAADYRTRYEEVAPEEVRAVLEQVRVKMEQGLSPERLAFVVGQAQPPRNCTAVENRRFLAKTENYDGANTWVRFNDMITVTATGRAANNGREQWYDPAQPVTVVFSPLGDREEEVTGQLPIEHSMIFKGKEYRFTAAPGARGFVEVTADWCDYGAG